MVRVFWQIYNPASAKNETFNKDYPTATHIDSDFGVLYLSDVDGENVAVFAQGQWTSAEYIEAN